MKIATTATTATMYRRQNLRAEVGAIRSETRTMTQLSLETVVDAVADSRSHRRACFPLCILSDRTEDCLGSVCVDRKCDFDIACIFRGHYVLGRGLGFQRCARYPFQDETDTGVLGHVTLELGSGLADFHVHKIIFITCVIAYLDDPSRCVIVRGRHTDVCTLAQYGAIEA